MSPDQCGFFATPLEYAKFTAGDRVKASVGCVGATSRRAITTKPTSNEAGLKQGDRTQRHRIFHLKGGCRDYSKPSQTSTLGKTPFATKLRHPLQNACYESLWPAKEGRIAAQRNPEVEKY